MDHEKIKKEGIVPGSKRHLLKPKRRVSIIERKKIKWNMFLSKCKTEFKNKTYLLLESQHSWYINWKKFLCHLGLTSKRNRDMGIFYTFVAACLAQRWAGLTFMSYGGCWSKKSTVTVWMHMYTLCTLIVWMYMFTKIQKMKTPLRHKAKTFLPTQSSTIVIYIVVMSEKCRQGLCPQCWIVYECRSKSCLLQW